MIAAAGLSACGARSEGAAAARPSAREPISHPLEIYRDVGFLTGSAQFPVVAGFATLAGPGDSTYVLLGLSLPNSALRFQRDNDGFFAEYRVDLAFIDVDSVTVKRIEARERVRVSTFAETGRTDESIVYQQGTALPPGRYLVRLQAADANSSRGSRMSDTLDVPDYSRTNAIPAPVLVHEGQGRTARDALPQLIVNPRNTVAFGGSSPRVYVEAYGTGAGNLELQVARDDGSIVWNAPVGLSDAVAEVRYAVVEIPSQALPLGKFWIEQVGAGPRATRTPLIMTISDQWMVANMDEVVQFLRYVAQPEELDSLMIGSPGDQRTAWERFWERRDPLPITDVNEYRDAFFQRVRYATEAFREPGMAGWNTDRGEVYIVLGPPDNMVERYVGNVDMTGQPNAEEWMYTSVAGGRLNLVFHDRSGFGRYQLVPSSASSFRSVANRLKARPLRN